MSVIKSQRSESEMEFLATARKLQAMTVHKCVNTIPKRYTFFVATRLSDSAAAVYENVKRGNSVYPTNAHEAQIRRDYFLRAYAELQSLASQLELAHEIVKFEPKVMNEWSGLIFEEMRLVKAVLKKDKERYKNLN